MSEVEKRLKEQGITLPEVGEPIANYVPAVRSGNLVFVSGQGPTVDGEPVWRGRVGASVSEEDGYAAARLCAVNCIAALRYEVGDLDRVARIVKILGFVASADDFERQPFVMNGASDLLTLAFGDAGRHARSAIGTSKLPFDFPVEVELIAELTP